MNTLIWNSMKASSARRLATTPCVAASLTLPLLFVVLFLGFQSQVQAQESWHRMSIRGIPSGYIYEVTREIREPGTGQILIETTIEYKTVSKRIGRVTTVRSHVTFVEHPETGQLRRARMLMTLSKDQSITELIVDGDRAFVEYRTAGQTRTRTLPWNPEVRGPAWIAAGMLRMPRVAGTTWSVPAYSFDLGGIVENRYTYLGEATLEIDGVERTLHHIQSSNSAMSYMVTDEWRDDAMELVVSSVTQAGLLIETERCASMAEAIEGLDGEIVAEVFRPLSPVTNVLIPRPDFVVESLLRIRPKDPSLPLPSFELQRQQEEAREEDGEATVRIRTSVPDPQRTLLLEDMAPSDSMRPFLEASPFVQCDHALIEATAKEVVGDEKDVWKAAQRLERFVFEHIDEKTMDVVFASALEVLESREGDCTEHGVLLAALCRSIGIPSRVVIGLRYIDGTFGGHLWTEVAIEDEWFALDATMGLGYVDALHLSLDESALEGTGLSHSMHSVNQGLGNMDIEILELATEERLVRLSEDGIPYTIEGSRYSNPLVGLALSSPEGFEFERLRPESFDPLLLRMVPTSPETMAESIEVRVWGRRALNLARAIEYVTESLEPSLSLARQVDGRDAHLLVGRDDDGKTIALLLIEVKDAIVTLRAEGRGKQEPARVLFPLLKSLDFDVQNK